VKFRVIPDDPKWAPQAKVAEKILNHDLSKPGRIEKMIRDVSQAMVDQTVEGIGYMKLKRKGKR
jgi:hypothetical protein